jgi:hypothetical protein
MTVTVIDSLASLPSWSAPVSEAVILLETDSGFQVLILRPYGWEHVGGLEFESAV